MKEGNVKNQCPICETRLKFFNKAKIADAIICTECCLKTNILDIRNMPLDKVRGIIEENTKKITIFNPTKIVGYYLRVDENSRTWSINKTKYDTIYDFNKIVSFELIEDGSSVKNGGIGRAVVGGILFGGVGAIVGATTASNKQICNNLQIKIVLNDISNPITYINFIDIPTKKDGSYQYIFSQAQECMSVLELICESNTQYERNTAIEIAPADEILKYKNLLDIGAITQEEFEIKKKELLEL